MNIAGKTGKVIMLYTPKVLIGLSLITLVIAGGNKDAAKSNAKETCHRLSIGQDPNNGDFRSFILSAYPIVEDTRFKIFMVTGKPIIGLKKDPSRFFILEDATKKDIKHIVRYCREIIDTSAKKEEMTERVQRLISDK